LALLQNLKLEEEEKKKTHKIERLEQLKATFLPDVSIGRMIYFELK